MSDFKPPYRKVHLSKDPTITYVVDSENRLAGVLFADDEIEEDDRWVFYASLAGIIIGLIAIGYYLFFVNEGDLLATIGQIFSDLMLYAIEETEDATCLGGYFMIFLISLIIFISVSHHDAFAFNFIKKLFQKRLRAGIISFKSYEIPLEYVSPSDITYVKMVSTIQIIFKGGDVKGRASKISDEKIRSKLYMLPNVEVLAELDNDPEDERLAKKVVSDLRSAISAVTKFPVDNSLLNSLNELDRG